VPHAHPTLEATFTFPRFISSPSGYNTSLKYTAFPLFLRTPSDQDYQGVKLGGFGTCLCESTPRGASICARDGMFALSIAKQ
jgi:hypothetical protein